MPWMLTWPLKLGLIGRNQPRSPVLCLLNSIIICLWIPQIQFSFLGLWPEAWNWVWDKNVSQRGLHELLIISRMLRWSCGTESSSEGEKPMSCDTPRQLVVTVMPVGFGCMVLAFVSSPGLSQKATSERWASYLFHPLAGFAGYLLRTRILIQSFALPVPFVLSELQPEIAGWFTGKNRFSLKCRWTPKNNWV